MGCSVRLVQAIGESFREKLEGARGERAPSSAERAAVNEASA